MIASLNNKMIKKPSSSAVLLALGLCLAPFAQGIKALAPRLGVADKLGRQIEAINESGGPVDIFWINSNTFEENLMGRAVENGRHLPLNSYVGHIFEVRESPNPETGCNRDSVHQLCRAERFKVTEDDANIQQIFRITSDFSVGYDVEYGNEVFDDEYDDDEYEDEDDDYVAETDSEEPEEFTCDEGTDAKDSEELTYVRVPSLKVVENMRPPGPRSLCRDQAKKALERMSLGPNIDAAEASNAFSEYVSCVEANATSELLGTNEVLSFQEAARNNVIDYFENYTCADFHLPTTSPIRNATWINKDKTYNVGILHERPRSKIHVIADFITDEECQAVENAAKPGLHVAAVADGTGGSTVSKHRKAMQAGVKVAWDKEADGDLIARLSRRVYDYANHVTGLNFRENGQEELMSIQYRGRGINDTEPDRYFPHCDGDCDGLPFKFGQRVATMVLYCTIPLKGGATNFRKAGIHVQPTKGFGAFFSYMDSDDHIMDEGFTEHSACPVVEGEKKVVVQWIRYGVDDTNPWDSFNSLGFKISEEY